MKKENLKNKEVKAKKENIKKVEKKESLFSGVKKEMGKVRWPLKKEMGKYSIAVFSFVIFFALFFMLADFIIAMVKVWVS